MRSRSALLLLPLIVALSADQSTNSSSVFDDHDTLARTMQSLRERGFTNITEADLRRDPLIWITNMFAIHADLPSHIWTWPAPQRVGTNRNSGVLKFIDTHGWSMETNSPPLMAMAHTEPISGLPWPQISHLTYPAFTYDGVLYVVLRGFGAESGGVAWNPNTNKFVSTIRGLEPLGEGWCAWRQ